MTYTSVSEALTALSGVAASEADIIAFVRQLPVSASGTTTLLYSGVIDGTPAWKIVEDMSDDIRRIDKTVAYTVLNSEEFITKVAQAYGLTYEAFQAELDNRGSTHPAKLWMNKGGSGPWAVASEMFVEATTGAVKIVTTAPLADSVLLRNEIPKLLDNPNVPTIDGVPRTEWAALRDSKGLDAVKQAIVANSFDQVVLSKLGIGNTENYLHWTDDAAQVAREDKALAKAYLETLEQLTVEQRSYLKAGATSLEDMAHSPTAGPGLIKKLGLIALPLSLTLAALDAKAAVAEGDNPRAFEIMKEWAIDAAGSSVAQAALGAVAALGTAALVAGGAIPAGFAAAVVVGAGLFGGFYGGDAAVDLYRWLLRDDSALGEVAEAVTTHFRAAFTLPKCDPLAIDLDSDGIETVGIGGAPVLFDHDGDGLRSGTGWLKPDDGWLVRDLNDNGQIDSGRELFGADTQIVVAGVVRNASSGFEALAALDTNADGVFDALDAAFGQLRIWRDLNLDGLSQGGELSTLAANGITGIELTPTGGNTDLGNGNSISGRATVHRIGGVDGEIEAVALADAQAANLDLADNPFYREFTTAVPLTEAAQAMPDMRGSGWVRDLCEAMSMGSAAAAQLQQTALVAQAFRGAAMADGRRLQ